ncbi:MAG: phenylacetate--CoA ligase family protein [Rhodospirillaceae bacterium]|nr:phenylacetate--CoA ligase family protein [Rhodospirillaceae bacterium]
MPTLPPYFAALDLNQMLTDHPIGDEFVKRFAAISRDELRAQQNRLFMNCVRRAWQIPFYQRLWGAAGAQPGDIRSLDDIERLPVFSKSDIMDSLALKPPFGDFGGVDFADAGHGPAVMHTTSGTTGTPQVLLFGPKTREMQNLLVARAYLWQGLKGSDVVHSVYGHGMVNAGHYMREAVLHFTNAVFMSAGTGVETRSVQQIQLMKRFGATVIVGFIDYVKRLAQVAREDGVIPGRDIKIRMISGHFGRENKAEISEMWGGAECFDWYGVGDTGIISSEGPDHTGMYVWEDAHYVEILDVDTGKPVPPGQSGDIVTTVLFKDDVYPMIRFNTHDVSAFAQTGGDALAFRQIQGILGRSDNMVKLRGINVFPHGIGGVLNDRPEFAGEFFCRAVRDAAGRDDMIVMVEVTGARDTALQAQIQTLLKTRIGVEMIVELHPPGALADLTEVDKRQKPKRLSDERFKR